MFMVNNILVTDNQMFITFTNKNKKLMKLTFLPIFVYSDFSEWTQNYINHEHTNPKNCIGHCTYRRFANDRLYKYSPVIFRNKYQ